MYKLKVYTYCRIPKPWERLGFDQFNQIGGRECSAVGLSNYGSKRVRHPSPTDSRKYREHRDAPEPLTFRPKRPKSSRFVASRTAVLGSFAFKNRS